VGVPARRERDVERRYADRERHRMPCVARLEMALPPIALETSSCLDVKACVRTILREKHYRPVVEDEARAKPGNEQHLNRAARLAGSERPLSALCSVAAVAVEQHDI